MNIGLRHWMFWRKWDVHNPESERRDQSFSGELLYEVLKVLRSDWAEGLASGHGDRWEFEPGLQTALAADTVGAAHALFIAIKLLHYF